MECDVIDHRRLDQARARRRQHHGVNAAARGSDENAAFDAGRRQYGLNVGVFGHHVVMGGVAVPLRQAAAAVIERRDAAAIGGQMRRQRVKIAAGAGKARQADNRRQQAGVVALAAQ